MKAMIFAAGLGTRLQPLTDKKPKALIEINKKHPVTLLELIVTKLKAYNFNDIIINVHHFADKVIKYLEQNNNFGIKISISDETGKLLDTGGGLKKVADFFNDNKPFLVHNVDILSNINLDKLYEQHVANKALVTLAVRKREGARFLLFDNKNNLCGWENTKTNEIKIAKKPNNNSKQLAFSGIQIISPEIFELIEEKNNFSIIDLYLRLAANAKLMTKYGNIMAHRHDNDTIWMDVGKKENLEQADKIALNLL